MQYGMLTLGIASATVVLIASYLFTGAIDNLPLPVIGATITFSLLKSFNAHEPLFLWREFEIDFISYLITGVTVIAWSPSAGAYVMMLSAIFIAYSMGSKTSHDFQRIKHSRTYKSEEHHFVNQKDLKQINNSVYFDRLN